MPNSSTSGAAVSKKGAQCAVRHSQACVLRGLERAAECVQQAAQRAQLAAACGCDAAGLGPTLRVLQITLLWLQHGTTCMQSK